MTEQKPRDISEDLYHRVYRLVKRKLSPHSIAATLNLPLRTILGVINKIERPDDISSDTSLAQNSADVPHLQEFLDIYFYPKTRYAILDLVGVLSDANSEKLRAELDKVVASSWKAVAVRMSDVTGITESVCSILVDCKDRFTLLGRYFAILDPAPSIEQNLMKYNIENAIPIFGTESAFEDAAYSKKAKSFTRRGTQNS